MKVSEIFMISSKEKYFLYLILYSLIYNYCFMFKNYNLCKVHGQLNPLNVFYEYGIFLVLIHVQIEKKNIRRIETEIK